MAEPDRLQSREPKAATGAAGADRQLVADQLAAAAGESRQPTDQARTLLPASCGESSDAAAAGPLRKNAAPPSPAG
jgi:hypothetical protein